MFSKSSIETFYSFKRDKIILFRKNEEYEGYWEETRYLERQDKDGKTIFEDGMAVVIMGNNSVYQYSMEDPFPILGRFIQIEKSKYTDFNIRIIWHTFIQRKNSLDLKED